jgi:hypothetical protein
MSADKLLVIGFALFLLWVGIFFLVMECPTILGGIEYRGYEYGFMVGLLILFENISNLPWWWQVIFWLLSFGWPFLIAGTLDAEIIREQSQQRLDNLEKKLKEPLNGK